MTNDSERTYGIDTAAEITISAYYKRHPEALTASGKTHFVTLGRINGTQGMSVMGTYSPDVNRQT